MEALAEIENTIMIIGFSGHRKIGGYVYPNPIYNKVYQETEKYLLELKPEKVISGFAIGYDQIAAHISYKLKISVIAAVPFIGQELNWPKPVQEKYHAMLKLAERVEIVSKDGYAAYKMQVRNEWIVNNCDLLLACFDGSKGGTYNCIEYAKSKNKPIIVIEPKI